MTGADDGEHALEGAKLVHRGVHGVLRVRNLKIKDIGNFVLILVSF